MKGEFNPSKNKNIPLFEYSEKAETMPLQKQKRIQDTVYSKHLRSSIDFNHPLGEEKKYLKKNKDFYSYNEFLTKSDLQCTGVQTNVGSNPISVIKAEKYKTTNTFKSKSINLNFGNDTNPITNPISEKNIFKVGLRDKKDSAVGNKNNKTFMSSESSILSSHNLSNKEKSFKQFSMGKITNQSIISVSEKTNSVDIPTPIVTFAHYKDPFSKRTFYKES